MESVEEGTTHEVLGPDHARGLNQKLAAETSEAEASEGGGQDEEGLKYWTEMEAVILIGNNDGCQDIGWDGADVRHHVDEDMLLDVEGPRVECEFAAAENARDDPGAGGEDKGECLAERVCDEEGAGRKEKGSGIAEVKKGVDGDANEHQSETEEPHAECHGGHFWVVDVADARAYFGIGRVFFLLCRPYVGELVGHSDALGGEIEGRCVEVGGNAFVSIELDTGKHRVI